MVQMKGCLRFRKQDVLTLYIPHGSDESKAAQKLVDTWEKLYIPHGSDESKR